MGLASGRPPAVAINFRTSTFRPASFVLAVVACNNNIFLINFKTVMVIDMDNVF
jgi:hypothetical protein